MTRRWSVTPVDAPLSQEFSAKDAETLQLPDTAERDAAKLDPFVALENAVTRAGLPMPPALPAMSTLSAPGMGVRAGRVHPYRRDAKAASPVDDVDDEEEQQLPVARGPQAQLQARAGIAALHARNAAVSKDDYTVNKALRRAMRTQRAEVAVLDRQRAALGLPEHIALLPPAPEDAAAAASVRFGGAATGRGFSASRHASRQALRSTPVLAAPASSAGTSQQAALLAKRQRLEAAGVRFGGSGARESPFTAPRTVAVRK